MHSCIIVSFVFVLINTKSMRVTNAQSLPTRSDLCFSDSFQFFRIHDLNNGPHVALCVNVSNPSVMKGVYIPGVRCRLETDTPTFSLMRTVFFEGRARHLFFRTSAHERALETPVHV